MDSITLSTENFQKLIQNAVRDEIYNITHNLSSEDFEDFLRAKRYDNIIEEIENGKRALKSQTTEEFLDELRNV